MIDGYDSSIDRPTLAMLPALRGVGVRLWSGYLATMPDVGLESPWDLQSFDIARQLGGMPLGFCSGWDDPNAIRQLARAWRVRPCLDVEAGIRDLGPWTQGWLTSSGAGVYGGQYVHEAVSAKFHVAALYPGGSPMGTWPPGWARPEAPTGWQQQGSHTVFGVSVDSGQYDDFFLGVAMAAVVIGNNSAADPHGPGATYLVADPVYGPKRWLPDGNTVMTYTNVLGPVESIDQFVLDRMEEQLPAASGTYLVADQATVAQSIQQLHELVAALGNGAPDPAVKLELDALSKHLGVGVP